MRNYLINTMGGFPSVFDRDFDTIFNRVFSIDKQRMELMKTDIKEDENGYRLEIDLPGFNKEEIEIDLLDGYLTVNAKQKTTDDKGGKYLVRERTRSYKRSYYIGENFNEEDVQARYADGVLYLSIPRENQKKLEPKRISVN